MNLKASMSTRCKITNTQYLWILLFLVVPLQAAALISDGPDKAALLSLMQHADLERKLDGIWDINGDPCNDGWFGVTCTDPNIGRVTHLSLENMALGGTIPQNTLGRLVELRVLSLKNNSLTGTIPSDLSNCRNLKQLYLSSNNLSGPIPDSFSRFSRLKKLSLEKNTLEGSIPLGLSELHGILSFTLDHNRLNGSIPDLAFPNMTKFDVSFNKFSGKIPASLAHESIQAFAGNNDLCGIPLSKQCPQSPSPPHLAAPAPKTALKKSGELSKTAKTIIIVLAIAIILLLLAAIILYCRKRQSKLIGDKAAPTKSFADDHQSVETASLSIQYPEQIADTEMGKLVFINEKFNKFDLKDLLRASAELLGKGTLGTTYKAVVGDGVVVAVKRLIDKSLSEKKEFEQQMELIGKLKHPNLITLHAYYYYAKEEKLLVYEYLPNKNLYTRLHGNRSGADRVALSWAERLRIAHGVAQGLAFLHHECESQKMPHGNIKSSNIIFDGNNEPRISDFGLFPFMNTSNLAQKSDGYRAPEYNVTRRVTQKADIYSFGVMLLELLTGRVAAMQGTNVDLPRWVNSVVREEWTAEVFDYELVTYRKNLEEEMVYLLRVAMDCVSPTPDQRPKMSQVVKIIEDIIDSSSPNPSEASYSSSDMGYSHAHSVADHSKESHHE